VVTTWHLCHQLPLWNLLPSFLRTKHDKI
jgi:hypothetical protein